MKIVPQSAQLLAITPNSMRLIERCGRVCYKSEDKLVCERCEGLGEVSALGFGSQACPDCLKRATTFVMGIIKRGHESVLEHASATLLLVTDRGMTHEIVRHRVASYSQESTRYCNYGNKGGEITVIKPDLSESGNENQATAGEAWHQAMTASEDAYLGLIGCGVAPQHARSVLPTCLKTEIAVTANMRQWRHMMGLRLGNKAGKAHPQIRALFRLIRDKFLETEVAPLFEEFVEE